MGRLVVKPERQTRTLKVRHKTTYSYSGQVDSSRHATHLRPIDDWRQRVLAYDLKVSPVVQINEHEDVFGNWTQRFAVTEPYKRLTIEATSVVEVLDVDPFEFARKSIQPLFPLPWMPWERTMLAPYLTPRELPDTQLQELFDYAMSFVDRNSGDLMETLFDINLTLYREYEYVPDSTTLQTSAYEVYCSGRGVCQDFSNLFITLARLLGVPARYVCGYIWTGNGGRSRTRSDATHAWVQLYIPNIGWKGFDPTNGTLPTTDHVRIGYGRYYRDITPTSGTITGKFGRERMKVEVEVEEVETKISRLPPAPVNSSLPDAPMPGSRMRESQAKMMEWDDSSAG